VYPILQKQEVMATLETGELLYRGQFKQVARSDAPTAVEYLPAGQLVQVDATVAAVVIEYFPAAQLVQAAAPDVVL
jgi:hypothetical protein